MLVAIDWLCLLRASLKMTFKIHTQKNFALDVCLIHGNS